jgi:hypothetical protein
MAGVLIVKTLVALALDRVRVAMVVAVEMIAAVEQVKVKDKMNNKITNKR